MAYETKRAELKALDESGTGAALFSVWDFEDLDGDVTRRGFFGNGVQEVFMLPHHLWTSGDPPLAKGTIYEEAEGAVYRFQMNTDIQAARDWLSHFRFDLRTGQAPRQVWSYGFRVHEGGGSPRVGHNKGRELHARSDGQPGALVVEVGPVTAAAQPLSRTLGAKMTVHDHERMTRMHAKLVQVIAARKGAPVSADDPVVRRLMGTILRGRLALLKGKR